MPSAEIHTMSNNNSNSLNAVPLKSPEFKISSKDVEGLVMEIKKNLRLSASTLKAIPCSQTSRKSSRTSPYHIPTKICCNHGLCDPTCSKKLRRKQQSDPEDPYEFLQKLLRDGSLVNEAVRRVQLQLTPKQRYFYESDEDSSPVLHLRQGN